MSDFRMCAVGGDGDAVALELVTTYTPGVGVGMRVDVLDDDAEFGDPMNTQQALAVACLELAMTLRPKHGFFGDAARSCIHRIVARWREKIRRGDVFCTLSVSTNVPPNPPSSVKLVPAARARRTKRFNRWLERQAKRQERQREIGAGVCFTFSLRAILLRRLGKYPIFRRGGPRFVDALERQLDALGSRRRFVL